MSRPASWLLASTLITSACSANRTETGPSPDVLEPPPVASVASTPASTPTAAAAPTENASASPTTRASAALEGIGAPGNDARDAGLPAPDGGTDAGDAGIATSGKVYVVAAIGDSLTDARSHGGGFLDELKRRCPESRFDNQGKGGNMVNQMRRRFARDVLGEEGGPERPAYTHLIVFGGVNDLYSDKTAFRSVPKISADLAAMYAAGRARGMRIVALTVAPWGGFSSYFTDARGQTTRQLNDWIRGRKAAGEVDHVIDAYALLSCGVPHRLCPDYTKPFMDGLHFGPRGHEVLGKALYEAVFSDCR
ncbi:GDSL-type esterase/lipase family protein [Chondromyces apiculatus]|uniref:SGNH hydrolase-type esterase domain-containing protein n=1 Tax=Chondromyces apiculatus DSM 436 TaxID=1192034 RepID=A0A017T8E4_9BACT|nr:GDSL-type esterase/lipase family protein [Chondromyces apiculatus]EYF04881.1 Hypothetical protein CAP_3907 [Chondromyces apiculatus DSM 436]